MPAFAVFLIDLAFTTAVITAAVQLGRVWHRWRGDESTDDSDGWRRWRPQPRPPGPERRSRGAAGPRRDRPSYARRSARPRQRG